MISRKYKQRNDRSPIYTASHTTIRGKDINCPTCKQRLYIGRDLKAQKAPLLLPCGHLRCSTCEIKNPAKPCLQCSNDYFYKELNINLPYNIYLTGLIHIFNSVKGPVEDVEISFQNQHSVLKSSKSELLNKTLLDTLVVTFCPNHVNSIADYLCKECKVKYCSHCIINYHKLHDIIHLGRKNEGLMPEFKTAYEKLQRTIKQIYQTQKVNDY